MNKRNFLIGMGMGMAAGCGATLLMRPKKRFGKTAVGRTLKAMGNLADSVSAGMGW